MQESLNVESDASLSDSDEQLVVRVDAPEEGPESLVFTASGSNHRMSFSSADTCCSCTS